MAWAAILAAAKVAGPAMLKSGGSAVVKEEAATLARTAVNQGAQKLAARASTPVTQQIQKQVVKQMTKRALQPQGDVQPHQSAHPTQQDHEAMAADHGIHRSYRGTSGSRSITSSTTIGDLSRRQTMGGMGVMGRAEFGGITPGYNRNANQWRDIRQGPSSWDFAGGGMVQGLGNSVKEGLSGGWAQGVRQKAATSPSSGVDPVAATPSPSWASPQSSYEQPSLFEMPSVKEGTNLGSNTREARLPTRKPHLQGFEQGSLF